VTVLSWRGCRKSCARGARSEYEGTALSWAIYGSGNSWHRDTGDFVGTVQALLAAGAILPPHAEDLEPSEAVLELLP
jgi:hypothetical protein